MTHTAPPNTIHEGRNIKRFREMLQIKQEGLADLLGDDWTQKKISQLEAKESIDPAILAQVSAALKIPVEAFQNFDEEQAVNIIANTITNNDNATMHSLYSYYPTINPIEEIKKLHEEKIALYERMIKEKDEMMVRLERLIEKN